MSTNYRLRQCIDAHDNDVKSLFILPHNNGILSASRDLSVRFWKEENKQFQQEKQFLFHKSYISTVHYMKPNSQNPDGIIFSAGYDKVIKGYFLNSNSAHISLTGHTNTVNSIWSDTNGNIISGSMDSTVILWDLSTCSIKKIFKGHKHGIWSVIILDSLQNHFLTASADKEIFLWNISNENPVKKFKGHTDCVRALVEISKTNQFLSCSNDNAIRLWSLNSGTCLSVFHGHSSFIYSMIKLSDDRFVSCGEDGLLCIWSLNNKSAPLQSIVLKAQSVWCVSALANDDIVAGSSDGMIRLFSEDPQHQNGIEIQQKVAKENLDDNLLKSLPGVGIERLSLPGEYDKQILKVSDEGTEILYEWSSEQELWLKKRVIGSSALVSGGAPKTHDYVFSIDIKDGEPPLKLHYNIGQDPWLVAKEFLDDNDLSPMFLDQVANFIITNSNQQMSTSQQQQQQFTDPFTGNSRYVPMNLPDSTNNSKQFPHMTYFRYDQINAPGLSKKIQEITISNKLPDAIINHIENIQNLSTDNSLNLCNWILTVFNNWPDDQLFPLIDLLRMLVRDSACNALCFNSNEFLTKLLTRTILSNFSKGNTLTMIKLMVNAFIQIPGEKLMNSMNKQITEGLKNVIKWNSDKNIFIAVASWLLNMSVFINIRREEYKRLEVLDLCFMCLKVFETNNCPEAVHRVLVTIGTLVCNIDTFTFRETLTMNVFEKINNISKTFSDQDKWGNDVKICSQQLGVLISTLDFLNF